MHVCKKSAAWYLTILEKMKIIENKERRYGIAQYVGILILLHLCQESVMKECYYHFG